MSVDTRVAQAIREACDATAPSDSQAQIAAKTSLAGIAALVREVTALRTQLHALRVSFTIAAIGFVISTVAMWTWILTR